MGKSTELKIQPSDFFIEDTYVDVTGRTLPCYDITRKGCEFIANKLTGQKGTLFTASYINRFHEMEKGQCAKLPPDKNKRLEIQEKNARAKTASLYLRIADSEVLPTEYRGVFLSYASKELSGVELLPLPRTVEKTYTATEIASEIGISSKMVGKIANANNLKTSEYAIEVWDKSRHSAKQVPSWRYNEKGKQRIKEILGVK